MKRVLPIALALSSAQPAIARADDYLNLKSAKIPVINGKEGAFRLYSTHHGALVFQPRALSVWKVTKIVRGHFVEFNV
jgi:hypothetical protein